MWALCVHECLPRKHRDLTFRSSLFLQVVLFCTLARLAAPARVLAALQVDTRPSRPPPTHSLHPQRASPFRRLGP